MKNWLPFVFGPEFAMETIPLKSASADYPILNKPLVVHKMAEFKLVFELASPY